MSTERKASEILLSLENMLKSLTGIAQNIDNNIKLLLNRTANSQNQASIAMPKAKVSVRKKPQATAESPDKPAVNSYSGQAVKEQPYDLDDYGDPELLEEVVPKGQRRTARVGENIGEKKVAVSQLLQFADGRPIFMASVEIFDMQNKLVKQARSNAHGRWLAPLTPGDYMVHILKRMQDPKLPPLELRFKVNVPETSEPVEIPSPEIEI